MAPLALRRTPTLLALALTSTLLAVASPASAAPVEGSLTAHTGSAYRAGCEVDADGLFSTVSFSNRTGPRTAQMDQDVTVSDTGAAGDPVAATAYGTIETTASARVQNRAFKRVDVESTGVVVVGNDAAADCAASFTASSRATADLRVRARGRIRIAWDTHVGDLALVSLVGPAGTVLSRDPSRDEGVVTLRVRPGTYELRSEFAVSAAEADAPSGGSLTKVGYYTLRATYLPPA